MHYFQQNAVSALYELWCCVIIDNFSETFPLLQPLKSILMRNSLAVNKIQITLAVGSCIKT
jgi:hypothetical protein